MNTLLPDELVSSLHDKLLFIQNRMRRLRLEHTTGDISPAAGLLLPIIASSPRRLSPKEIADRFGMAESNMSRLCTRLTKQGWIELRPMPDDRRRREVGFLPRGREIVKEMCDLDNRICHAGLRGLSTSEIEVITKLFNLLSTALGVTDNQRLPEHELIVQEQVRLGEGLGMMGGSYLGSGMDVSEYQVLRVLSAQSAPLPFSNVAELVPLEITGLRRLIERWSGEGLIKTLPSSRDKRVTLVQITRKGRTMLERLSAHADRVLAERSAKLPRQLVRDFVAAISHLENLPFLSRLDVTMSVAECKSPSDWLDARAFLVETLVRRREHKNLPQVILPRDSQTYLVRSGSGDVVGLATDSPPNKSGSKLVLFQAEGADGELAAAALRQRLGNR